MSLSRNIESYQDVDRLLNSAKMLGGLRFKMPTHGSAVRWRQRAYNYRKLVRENNHHLYHDAKEVELRARAGSSPWEGFIIQVEGDEVIVKLEDDKSFDVRTLDGKPVDLEGLSPGEVLDEIAGPPAPVPAGAFETAHKLMQDLGLESKDD